MTIQQIRRAIDRAQNLRTDFQGHRTDEFMAADVGGLLRGHIQTLQALQIPAKFTEDERQRRVAMDACARLVERWDGLRAAKAATLIAFPAGGDAGTVATSQA
ncbi:hypothetical protein DBR42_18885 [Pelomonas sp. HMWF004]|nr:hypothetical protein DBR42_18885 [Pelomonas sp. HMWF004]